MLRAAGEVKANQEFVVLQVVRGDTEGALEVALGRRVSVAAQQGMASEVLGAPDVQPAQHLAVIHDPVLAIVIRQEIRLVQIQRTGECFGWGSLCAAELKGKKDAIDLAHAGDQRDVAMLGHDPR